MLLDGKENKAYLLLTCIVTIQISINSISAVILYFILIALMFLIYTVFCFVSLTHWNEMQNTCIAEGKLATYTAPYTHYSNCDI